MIWTILLWIIALLFLFVLVSILWARLVVQKLRDHHNLYMRAHYEPHPLPLPKIVESEAVLEIRESIEQENFKFLGYLTNKTRYDAGIPDISLAFTSSNGCTVASVNCTTEPRRFLHLPLPLVHYTGKTSVLVSLDSFFSQDCCIVTSAIDMQESHRHLPPHFDLYYLNEGTDFHTLLENHRKNVEEGEHTDSVAIKTLSDFIESCNRNHQLLSKHSKREFEEIIDEAKETWPVDIDPGE